VARKVCFVTQLLSVLQMVDKLLCWCKQTTGTTIKNELIAFYRGAWSETSSREEGD
jgi:hypothetical protein